MREKFNHLYLDSHERKLLIHSLVELKNQLIQQGRYTDCLVIVVGLYLLKPHEVFIISMLRVILVAAMFGNGMSLMYSLAGGILSFAAMALLSRAKGFSMIGISILGGVCHNIGQIIVAAVAVENLKIMYYFPVLLIAGIVTGAVIGIISGRILKIAQKTFVNENKKVKNAQTKVNMDKSAGSVKRW